jgi:O-antigen/teichoic acid export membrane protein
MRYAFVGSKPTPVDRKGITLNYAFPAFVTTISATVIKNGQYIMLTMIRSAQATGLFNIAMLISSPIQVLPSILSLAIGPILSALSVGRNKKLQASLMGSVFRYVMFVSLLFSILVIMFSKNLIFLFSRKEYLPATVLFPFICLATVFLSAGDVFNTCLYSTGKAKIQRNIILATLAVFLMVSVPLTYLFSATGMAISYAISMFMLSYLSYYYANKFIRVKLDFKPLFKLIASSAAMAIFLYLTSTFVYGLLSVAVFGLIGTAIYLLALIPLKFYNEEDVKVIRFLGEKVPALQRPMNKIADLLSRFV